jgi:hypothetical protein
MESSFVFRVSCAIVFIALCGCESTPHSDESAPPVTLLPDPRVVLDQPVIKFDHGSVFISGTVHRGASQDKFLSGRVDIEFLTAEGEILDEIPALLEPRILPANGDASTYDTNYGLIPPKGSTLRIHFVDSQTMAREDLVGGEFEYGNAGGNFHPNTHAGHTAGFGTGGYGGNFGGNFGAYNFGPGHR